MRRGSFLIASVLVFVPSIVLSQGDPLGPEFRVNTYTTSYQSFPSLAADASGNFIVVWQSYIEDGSLPGVFGQRYASSGVPLGPEFRVNTYTTNTQTYPSVAAESTGDFVVVWESRDQDLSNYGVFGQRYASTGTPLGPEFRVNTVTGNFQGAPSVAKDPAAGGNFWVVWESVQLGASDVFGQRYSSSGLPLGTEFRVNSYTTDSQSRPVISADVSGGFVVVWESRDQDGSSYGIFAQRYSGAGSPVGAEFRVNTYTTSEQRHPSVAADSTGNFIIVWDSNTQDGSSSGVFGQRYASSGAPLGPEFRVNTSTSSYQFDPSVAADSTGNFVVAWTGDLQDGSYAGMFGQRYSSSGASLGTEFRINTYTTSYQGRAGVAADPSGDFVVVWGSSGGDGSSGGIFGQRYGQIVPVELMRFRVE